MSRVEETTHDPTWQVGGIHAHEDHVFVLHPGWKVMRGHDNNLVVDCEFESSQDLGS